MYAECVLKEYMDAVATLMYCQITNIVYGLYWELCMHVEMVSKMCVRLIANSLIKHVNL